MSLEGQVRIKKNYNSFKLTRHVIDSGMHPLNWFLDKSLGGGEL